MAGARSVRTYEGGCLCGAVRFAARGPVANPHTCSCRMCRRHTGALTAAWVEFPRDAVAWTGPAGRRPCGARRNGRAARSARLADAPNRRELAPTRDAYNAPARAGGGRGSEGNLVRG